MGYTAEIANVFQWLYVWSSSLPMESSESMGTSYQTHSRQPDEIFGKTLE